MLFGYKRICKVFDFDVVKKDIISLNYLYRMFKTNKN